MALQKTFMSKFKVEIINAYHKAIKFSYSIVGEDTYVEVVVGSFPDPVSAEDGTPPIEVRAYTMSGFDIRLNINAHTQVYYYLKTLDDFKDAIDV